MFRFHNNQGRHKPKDLAEWRKSIRDKSKPQAQARPQLRAPIHQPHPPQNIQNNAIEASHLSSLYFFIFSGLKLGAFTFFVLIYYSALFKEMDEIYLTKLAKALQQHGLFNSSNQCLAVNSIDDAAVMQLIRLNN